MEGAQAQVARVRSRLNVPSQDAPPFSSTMIQPISVDSFDQPTRMKQPRLTRVGIILRGRGAG
jgi:hypothetical protein